MREHTLTHKDKMLFYFYPVQLDILILTFTATLRDTTNTKTKEMTIRMLISSVFHPINNKIKTEHPNNIPLKQTYMGRTRDIE